MRSLPMVFRRHRAAVLVASLALAALGLNAGCKTAPEAPADAGATAPTDGEPADQAPEAADAPPATPAVDDLELTPDDCLQVDYESGLDLGLPEPETPVTSPYADGLVAFSYGVTRLGRLDGRELVVVLMNVETGMRITLPSGRARVAFMSSDGGAHSAEAGVVTIENADATSLTGTFEVRFDELEQAVVRGRFAHTQSSVPPQR